MTKELRHTLVDHAAGNYRIFITMAGELLIECGSARDHHPRRELYLQVFARPDTPVGRRAANRG